ncbi:MAG: hypothetical protein ACT4OY_04575 [Alphaproteobacteria bacterium]
MQNNKGLLIIIALVVVAILAYLVGTRSGDDGFNIKKGDSVGEVLQEVGDEIDDATTN